MTHVVLIGLCSFYSPGVMERVADYRGLTAIQNLPPQSEPT